MSEPASKKDKEDKRVTVKRVKPLGTGGRYIRTLRISRKAVVAAALQDDLFSPAAFDWANDGLEVYDVELNVHLEEHERKMKWRSFTQLPAVKGIHYAELSFTADFFEGTSDGTIGGVPFWSRFLLSAGFRQEVTPDGHCLYRPTSELGRYLTLAFNLDGITYILAHAQGDLEFQAKVGAPLQVKAKYIGKLVSVSDEDLGSNLPFRPYSPMVFLGSTVGFPPSIYPYTYEITFGLGTKVVPVRSSHDEYGFVHAQIVDRDPKASIKFQAGLLNDYNFYSAFRSGEVLQLIFTVGGIEFSMWTQISEYKEPDEDGIVAMEFPLRLVHPPNSPNLDDELSITFMNSNCGGGGD